MSRRRRTSALTEHPRWQRARFIGSVNPFVAYGAEIWVALGPPQFDAQLINDRGEGAQGLVYDTHLIAPASNPVWPGKSAPIVVGQRSVELLARGPEDFAEHVEPETVRVLS